MFQSSSQNREFIAKYENVIREVVGEKQDKYIEKWTADSFWKRINWAAFFFGLFWMGYRRMYKEVLIFMLILFAASSFSVIFSITIPNVFCIIFGLIGNQLYLNSIERKIKKIESSTTGRQEKLEKIKGPSILGIFAVWGILFIYTSVISILIMRHVIISIMAGGLL